MPLHNTLLVRVVGEGGKKGEERRGEGGRFFSYAVCYYYEVWRVVFTLIFSSNLKKISWSWLFQLWNSGNNVFYMDCCNDFLYPELPAPFGREPAAPSVSSFFVPRPMSAVSDWHYFVTHTGRLIDWPVVLPVWSVGWSCVQRLFIVRTVGWLPLP